MPQNWPLVAEIGDLVADLAGAAAERIALDHVVIARDRQVDQAKLAAGGIGLRDLIPLDDHVVRRVERESTRRIGLGRRAQRPCCP